MAEVIMNAAQSAFKDRIGDYEKKMASQRNMAQRPFTMPGQQQAQAKAFSQARQQMPQGQQTFAMMQQQGVARPAPPAPAQQSPQTVQRVGEALSRNVQVDATQYERMQQQLADRMIPGPTLHYAGGGQFPVLTAAQPAAATGGMINRGPDGMPVLTAGQPAAPMAQPMNVAPRNMPVLTGMPPAPAAPAAQAPPVAAGQPPAAQPQMLDRVRQNLPQTPGTAPQAAPAGQPVAMQPQQPMGATAGAQGDLRQRLMQQLDALSQQPGVYGTQEIQQMREAQRADLEAQFSAQRQQLEEEMARRGLSASSIAAGQFGDVAGQQARALATMEAGLTEKAAESMERGRSQLMQGLTQGLGLDLESRGLDIQDKKVQADIDAESKRLMQQDRSLDLQQARDLAQQNISYAQLAEQAKDRVSRENISMAQLQQQGDQFAQRLGLDRDQFEADVNFRAQQIAQQDRSLNMEEARFIAQTENERAALDQRAYEFANQYNLDLARFDSDENYRRIVIETMLAEFAGPGGGDQNFGPNVRPGDSGSDGRGAPPTFQPGQPPVMPEYNPWSGDR